MRLLISFIAVAVLASASLIFNGQTVDRVALASNSVQEEQPGDGARRISPSDAHETFDRGRAVIVDVRSLDSYKAEHVKGALSIPLAELETRLSELPRNKMIITYCT